MTKKPFELNLKTPPEDFCPQEHVKLNPKGIEDKLHEEFRNDQTDLSSAAEQLAKSHGIYLEFDRANKGEKHWMYMVRLSIPGGGPINREQWQLIDELAEKYTVDSEGNTSIRFTTRQNIQFHWINKQGALDLIKTLAEKDLRSLNGCGDNTRNVMSCPLSRFSNVFNANQWAVRAGSYFQLPLEPFIRVFELDPDSIRQPEQSFQYGPNLMNRKFKIGFSTVHEDPETGMLVPDNCVEMRTNDLGIAPVIENNRVSAFQLYVGGGQGERNGKPSMAALGEPLGIVTEDQLMPALDAVVQVHQEWGDRQNRHWARLKYVIKKMGVDWYRDHVTSRLGFPLERPNPELDYGARHLHFGWSKQPSNGLWSYGAFLENGRITDAGPNGKLKSMIRYVMDKYPIELMVTPNQDVIFNNIPEEARQDFEDDLKSFGYGQRHGKAFSSLRLRSGACVGRDTCRLTYTDSEKFEPLLIDELEQMGWGDLAESIGITGCERQCFRPSTKTIGLIGSGLNRYQLRLFGDETARFQGQPLISTDGEEMHMRSIPREEVAAVLDALFSFYTEKRKGEESLGEFNRRLGADALISFFKSHPKTTGLMEKPFNTDCVID